MRESLRETVNHALCIEMKLPNIEKNLDKTSITTAQDICMKNDEKSELAKIIYNGIVEYAVNEYELNYDDLEKEQAKVLARRIRYNSNATDFTKLKYGFYGEVLLDLILRCFLKTDVLLARGYLYSPIEKSEVIKKYPLVTKGALLYLPIRKVMCALILFRELRDKSRSRLYLAQTRSAIHTLRQSRYFLFFLPRPFPLADLNAVE